MRDFGRVNEVTMWDCSGDVRYFINYSGLFVCLFVLFWFLTFDFIFFNNLFRVCVCFCFCSSILLVVDVRDYSGSSLSRCI